MRDWYIEVLGATVAFENPMLCFLAYDDEHHRIGLIAHDQPPEEVAEPEFAALPFGADVRAPRANGSLNHVAFNFSALDELMDNYERLKDSGIAPFWAVNHGPTTSLYYQDPDGNRVELNYDNLTDPKEIEDFFATRYPTNPIGVEFDVDDLLRRLRSGEAADQLVKI